MGCVHLLLFLCYCKPAVLNTELDLYYETLAIIYSMQFDLTASCECVDYDDEISLFNKVVSKEALYYWKSHEIMRDFDSHF